MEKLRITKIAKFDKKKDGSALLTKTGKPYTSVRIQTYEHGETWLSGFGSPATDTWQVGDEIELEVTKNGDYLNWSLPKKGAALDEKIQEIDEGVERLQNGQVRDHILLERILEYIKPREKQYPMESNETAFDDIPEDQSPF